MYMVTGKYTDYKHPLGESSFHLNADKDFNYQNWCAPIYWEGFVNNQKVKFRQIEAGAYSLDCFDWNEFPTELDQAKNYIVEAIDEAMKSMD